jgi:hypothetical protein
MALNDLFSGRVISATKNAAAMSANIWGLMFSGAPIVHTAEVEKTLAKMSHSNSTPTREKAHYLELVDAAGKLTERYRDQAAAAGKTSEQLEFQKLAADGLGQALSAAKFKFNSGATDGWEFIRAAHGFLYGGTPDTSGLLDQVLGAQAQSRMESANADMAAMSETLRDQTELWGMSADEIRIWKAELKGASKEWVEINKERSQLAEVQKMADQFHSPAKDLDQIAVNISKARRQWMQGDQRGGITGEDLTGIEIGQLQKFQQLERSLGLGQGGRFAPLDEGFSAQTVSTINANALANQGAGDMKDRVIAVKEAIERQREQQHNDALSLADALADLQVPQVADF